MKFVFQCFIFVQVTILVATSTIDKINNLLIMYVVLFFYDLICKFVVDFSVNSIFLEMYKKGEFSIYFNYF